MPRLPQQQTCYRLLPDALLCDSLGSEVLALLNDDGGESSVRINCLSQPTGDRRVPLARTKAAALPVGISGGRLFAQSISASGAMSGYFRYSAASSRSAYAIRSQIPSFSASVSFLGFKDCFIEFPYRFLTKHLWHMLE